jgi:hypothetical protein
LLETTGKTRIIISAVQFVKGGNKGTQFVREEIVKKTALAKEFQMGKDKKERFIEILKTRKDGRQGKEYKVDFDGSYSYMAADRNKSEEIIAI